MSKPSSRTAPEWSPASTHLRAGATANLRDLGGVPTADGRVIGRGRVYRAEALVRPGAPTTCSIWDEADAEAYGALGVRTVLDLRSAAEQERAPSAWPMATGADHVAVPIEEGGEGDTDYVRQIREGTRTAFGVAEMVGYYGLVLRNRPAEFGAALRVIARADRLPVLVHCAAGKDRTGLLVALLLETLGVPREVVVAEYALTGTLRPNRVAAYASLFGDSGVDLADIAVLFDAPADVMAGALAELDAEFGSAPGYLLQQCGLSREDLDVLRANLLVQAGL
ncbi:MAG: protein-tyrosine phosphatase [Pseudonocardiales bacterium]|nr:protein-tyrosine phosphatase [Pseudonocardiales bacterium]